MADEVLPLIGRFFPRFELRDIDSGHWVISEKPEPFKQGKLALLEVICGAEPGSCRRIPAGTGLTRSRPFNGIGVEGPVLSGY